MPEILKTDHLQGASSVRLTKKVLLAMQEAISSRCAGVSPGEEFGNDSEYHQLWEQGYYEKASEWVSQQLTKRERPDAAIDREAQRARSKAAQ